MKTNKILGVFFHDRQVGTLAMTSAHKAAFEYCDDWLDHGFPISPFSLPLKKQVFLPSKDYFNGLFGVFADSLPDAWGRLLLERLLRSQGQNPDELNPLDRLAIVGNSGMGALTYQPQHNLSAEQNWDNLDHLAAQCQKILNAEYTEYLDELYYLGGTSGGARPKILTDLNGESWIIKFPSHSDGKDAGFMEYRYALCAKKCGIDMSPFRLFPSDYCKGYFGTRRFDRITDAASEKRVHMLTAAAILELDFRQPSLDYHTLMKLTKILTLDNETDLENMYRRMCFNVFAHNRDDHSKNFSYIYHEDSDTWHLSPAYDLTFSSTYYGEHTTTVDGNGKNPGIKELLTVGTAAGMRRQKCLNIAHEIKDCVNDMLGEYL